MQETDTQNHCEKDKKYKSQKNFGPPASFHQYISMMSLAQDQCDEGKGENRERQALAFLQL